MLLLLKMSVVPFSEIYKYTLFNLEASLLECCFVIPVPRAGRQEKRGVRCLSFDYMLTVEAAVTH